MILDKINCECGSDKGWRIDATTAECWDCETVCVRGVNLPKLAGKLFRGAGNNDGFYSRQLGKRFHSESAMIAYAETQGLVAVSPNSAEWKDLKQSNLEGAEQQAKEAGYSDLEARRKDLRDNHRDHVANARQIKIDRHHADHGSADKKTVDTAFGDLPSSPP